MTRPSAPNAPPSGPGGRRSGAQVATPLPTGLIGRYQILDKIGEGGMGSLFLARDPAIDRLVAIKLLRHGLDTEPLRERFAREARAAGRLRHPHIVTIFDVGEHEGDPFIAMEFLAGETLAELIREGARLSLSRRLKLLEELCDGLAYAHRTGLVHRDIKPANLMVDADGVLKILDFGIVRVSDSGMTQAGALVGTVNYMSPEQVVGSAVDHRSDIFAVGLVAYELISGRQAFAGTMKEGLLNKILHVDAEPLPAVVPGVDAEVVSIVEQALKKDPADRYQDLVRMRNDLTRARLRIERQEEFAAAEAAADAGETAVIGEHATMASETPRVSPPPAHEAEQALAIGNFRAALTLAGRSAAINPLDRVASSIAARAEAALLDRGRLLHSGTPPSSPVATPSGIPASPPPASGSAVQTGGGHAIWIAVGIAVVALGIAVAGFWFRNPAAPAQVSTEKPDSASAESRPIPAPPASTTASSPPPPAPPVSPPGPDPTGGSPTPSSTPAVPAPVPEAAARDAEPPATSRASSGRGRRGEPERRPAPETKSTVPPPSTPAAAPPEPAPTAPAPSTPPSSSPAPPERPAGPLRAGFDVTAPDRKKFQEPAATGTGGAVGVELTIDPEGRVSDARVVRSGGSLDDPALAAVKRWEFEVTRRNGVPVSVIYAVDVKVPAAPAPAPKPSAPAAPPPAPSKPPDSGRAAAPPVADPREEIEAVLRRYKTAWESLNPEALERVQALSVADAAVVRRTMSDASRYQVDLTVKGVTVDPSGRTAIAQVTIVRRFVPKIGRPSAPPPATEVRFEKRGDSWIIMNIR
jgi:TonB family protein